MGGMAGLIGGIGSDMIRGIVVLSFAKLVLFLSSGTASRLQKLRNQPSQLPKELGVPILLLTLARTWLAVITWFVPDPYLDEVFHIPQAQTYCEGRLYDWDDKITTPPGLYALSILFNRAQGVTNCTPEALRSFNIYAIGLVALLIQDCRAILGARNSQDEPSPYAMHTALNAALFPILFFFSGLYYTDIASALAILLSYRVHLSRVGDKGVSLGSDLLVVLFGLLALSMRQTNVFWIVIFMGGLEVVHSVKCLSPGPSRVDPADVKGTRNVVWWYMQRFAEGDIHDPPVNLAWPDDTVISLASAAIAAASNPSRTLRQIWPYLAVLVSFGAFVAWNEGVVLGDKSNHVATIHVAQMLYIWPFFLFFSIPLCLSFGFHFAGRMTAYLTGDPSRRQARSSDAAAAQPKKGDQHSSRKRGAATRYVKPRPQIPQGIGLRSLDSVLVRKTYIPVFSAAAILLLAVVVKYNTLIHPFTLADNRHYMFYVFRYTIRRRWWMRYVLIFPYWTSLVNIRRCLAGCQAVYRTHCTECPVAGLKELKYLNSPFMDADMRGRRAKVGEYEGGKQGSVGVESENTDSGMGKTVSFQGPSSPEAVPPSTSTEAIWLIATTLSLVTAPLVEPRYFILPWLFWRLHVPAWRMHDCNNPPTLMTWLETAGGIGKTVARLGKEVDVRLFVETAWFVLINVATMYIFITRPFYWYDAEGNVADDGKVQRFMW